MQIYVYFASILLTCGLTAWLAFYARRQPGVPGRRVYTALLLCESLLAFAEILFMLSPGAEQAMFWFNLRFLFTALVPVLWLWFTLEYAGRKAWLSKRLIVAAFIIPVITQVMLWSNNLHGLWVKQDVVFTHSGPFLLAVLSARIPGVWFMLHSFYCMLVLLAGIGVILVAAWRKPRLYQGQAILISTGAAIALITSAIIPVFNLLPQSEFNLFIPGIGASAIFYALAIFRFEFLKRAPASTVEARPAAAGLPERRSLALFLLIFVLVVAGISAVGYVTYQNYARQFRTQVEGQLSSIATLKTDELQDWRRERLADAETLYHNPAFSKLVQHCLEAPTDAQSWADLQAWLDVYDVYHQYNRVSLLDTSGVERIASPARPEAVSAYLEQQAATVWSTSQTTFLDFHRDTPDGPIHLAILVPVLAKSDNHPLGLLVLRIDPTAYLYPFIQQWPGPSSSAETVLLRRDGNDVLFLNELKFQANTALSLHFPLQDTQLLAVKAALGQTGIVEGINYRGAASIGDVRAVPDSPWFLVSRMDTAEVYAPLQERLWQMLFLFGALIVAAGAGMALAWRWQQMRIFRASYAAAEALRESEEKFRKAFLISPDAVAINRLSDGRVVSANQSFLNILGYTEAEVVGTSSLEINIWNNPEDRQKITAGLRANGMVENFEATFHTKTGEIRNGLMSAAIITLNGEPHILNTARDITERKQIEMALSESERKFREIILNLDEGYYSVTLEGILLEHNQAFNRILGFPAEQDLRGTSSPDLWQNPADRQDYLNAFAVTGSLTNYQISAKKQNGEKITVLASAHLVKDENNRPLRIEGVFMDITASKRSEDLIRARGDLLEFSATHSYADILQTALDQVGVLTASPIGFYHFLESDQQTLSLQGWSTRTEQEFCVAEGKGQHYPVEQAGVWADCVRSKQPVIHNDYASLPHRKGLPEGHAPVQRELIVPTLRNGLIVAIVGVGNKPSDYTQADVDLVTYFADVAWEIVERKRADVALRRQNQFLAALQETTLELLAQLEPESLFENTVRRAGQLMGTSSGFLGLVDPESGLLVARVGLGAMAEALLHSIKPGESVVGKVWQTGQPLVVNDYDNWPERLQNYSRGAIASIVAVPLLSGDRVLGVLGLGHEFGSRRTFKPEDVEILTQFARLTAIAIENARLFSAARQELAERERAEQALRQREALLNKILDILPVGLWLADKNGTLVRSNKKGREIWGAEPLVDLEHYDVFKARRLPTSEELAPEDWALAHTIREGITILDELLEIDAFDGSKKVILNYSAPVFNDAGEIEAGIVVNLDITERIRAEEKIHADQIELQQLLDEAERSRQTLLSVVEDQKTAEELIRQLNTDLEKRVTERTVQLETSNKELESFAYSVSHDLRAPLRAIDGFSRILQQGYAHKLDGEGLRLLNIVRDNTSKMDHLITDLLALSRVGRAELKYSPIDMAGMANALYHELATPEVLKKFVLKIGKLPLASGDPTLMRQVWANLISNAIKYTLPKEQCVIEISGSLQDGLCTYSIRDTGVGFNPKYTEKLFGLFQRLHKAEEFEGTGVGLAIIQRIIRRHGGQVWGEGQVGIGATFYFTVPEKEIHHA